MFEQSVAAILLCPTQRCFIGWVTFLRIKDLNNIQFWWDGKAMPRRPTKIGFNM
jgi:hypothetical protein